MDRRLFILCFMVVYLILDHVDAGSSSQSIEDSSQQEDIHWMSTFILSFLMILGSELGDKTFLIAAVLAMRQSRLKIFSATMTAMIVMSILSAELGYLLPQFFPQWTVDLLAAIIFIIFSIVMLREGLSMTGEEQHQELEQVKAELEERQWQINDHEMIMMESGESNTKPPSKHSQLWQTMHRMTCHGLQVIFSPIFLQTFTLVFLAEWGDRSQFATIALAASQNVEWTIIGTLIGHTVCTGIAVIGGRLLAQRISVKTVTLIGSGLFGFFGFIYFYAYLHH